jgi:hypothetical protein
MTKDYPIEECKKTAAGLPPGSVIHQKFTCAGCGSRQTMAVPDTFFTSGVCEACGVETDIARQGCNYVAFIPMGGLEGEQE